MIRFENFKLFIILFFVLSVTTLIYNFQNPLFRMKLQLMMNGYKAEPQTKNLDASEGKMLSIYKLVNVPTRTPPPSMAPLPTKAYFEPTKIVPTAHQTPHLTGGPAGVSNRNLAVNKIEPTVFGPTATIFQIQPTITAHQTPRLTGGQAGVTKLVWEAIFKGVEAAENTETGAVNVKIKAGTEYTTRPYRLKDGQTIQVIVPIFRD